MNNECDIVNLEDTEQVERTRSEVDNPHIHNPDVDNKSSVTSTPQNAMEMDKPDLICSWDPDIGTTLGLKESYAKQLNFNDKVLLNILKPEIEQASRGPWNENIAILCKRTSHNSFWRKKVSELFPKHSSNHVIKKVNAMRTFFNKEENFGLVRDAMLALGVPSEICNEYNKSTRNSHIVCQRKTDPSSTTKKAVIPRYVTQI